MRCIIESCISKEDVSLHRFPQDECRFKLWCDQILAARKDGKALFEFVERSNARLCSRHFQADEFRVIGGKKKFVPGAIPTLFESGGRWKTFPIPAAANQGCGSNARPVYPYKARTKVATTRPTSYFIPTRQNLGSNEMNESSRCERNDNISQKTMKCFVPSCRIDFHKRNLCADGLVSKHRFPRDPERRLKWLDAIPNVGHLDPDTINFETVRICSKHFHRDSFVITDNKRELLASAVPSIFVDSVCDTPFYQEFYVISDGKVEIANPSEQLYYQDPSPEVKKQMLKEKSRKRPIRYAGDIDTTTISPEDAKNIALPKLIKKLEQANKTIRALRATNRRCIEKVARLEQIIDNKFQESVAKDGKASAAKPGNKQVTIPSGSTVTMEITPVVGGGAPAAAAAVDKDKVTIHEDDDAYDDDIIIEEDDDCELEEYGEVA